MISPLRRQPRSVSLSSIGGKLSDGIAAINATIEPRAQFWDQWNATIRDFVIVGRNGEELTRINLTYNNPDPDSTCGENYETIKNLILSFR